MHPAQINAISLLLNNLIQQAQAQLQVCHSLKQIITQGQRAPVQQVQMPMQEPGYLSAQEEALLGYGMQQAQQQAQAADQNFNPQMHDAFEAAAAGMLPHHPANRRQGAPRPAQQQMQQQQQQRPVQNGLGGGLAGFDPMMGLGDIMGGFGG